MILRRSLTFLLVFFSVLMLQACGNAADSGDKMGGGKYPPGGGGGGADVDNGRTVDVIVEGTKGIGGDDSVLARLLQTVLPRQALALAGQERLKVKAIKVVRLDAEGELVSREPFQTITYSVKYNNPDGSHR